MEIFKIFYIKRIFYTRRELFQLYFAVSGRVCERPKQQKREGKQRELKQIAILKQQKDEIALSDMDTWKNHIAN